jgi:pyridoxamine 5'-phosphate oxidase
MSINEVIEFANQNPASWLATVDEGKPRVRGLLLWFADESGFYYHSGTLKAVLAQIEAHPYVEAAFYNPGANPSEGRMLRVAGKVEFVDDSELEKRLFKERPWLNDIRAAFPNQIIRIFKIATGEAHFWDMTVNCREKEQPRFEF